MERVGGVVDVSPIGPRRPAQPDDLVEGRRGACSRDRPRPGRSRGRRRDPRRSRTAETWRRRARPSLDRRRRPRPASGRPGATKGISAHSVMRAERIRHRRRTHSRTRPRSSSTERAAGWRPIRAPRRCRRSSAPDGGCSACVRIRPRTGWTPPGAGPSGLPAGSRGTFVGREMEHSRAPSGCTTRRSRAPWSAFPPSIASRT